MGTLYVKPNLALWVLDRSQGQQKIFCAWKFWHLSSFAKIGGIFVQVPSPL